MRERRQQQVTDVPQGRSDRVAQPIELVDQLAEDDEQERKADEQPDAPEDRA